MITEFKGEYRWLSNFETVEIRLDGLMFHSVEHAYMSAKSNEPEWKKFCCNPGNSAAEVKRRSRTIALRADWDQIRLDVMRECLRQKYSREPYRTKLMETGTQHIQEGNMWNDRFWGVCLKTNSGANHLGRLIMEIRSELASSQVP